VAALLEAQVIFITAKTFAKQVAAVAVVAVLGQVQVARAQTPTCGPDTAGQLSEQAGVRCQCVEAAGGSITGQPSGYRWDCGILRGRMNQLIPATPNAYQGPLPESIIVDPAEVPLAPSEPWRAPKHPGAWR
jgi:hypothetical protein